MTAYTCRPSRRAALTALPVFSLLLMSSTGAHAGIRTAPRAGTANLDAECPRLLEWSQLLNKEYPSTDFERIMMDKAQLMAVPLFAEPIFSQYFGKPYEELDTTARQAMLHELILPCVTSTAYRSQFNFFRGALVSAWIANGSQPTSPRYLLPALAALREARAALLKDEHDLAALPATASSYDQVLAVQKSADPALSRVWPSERTAFQASVNLQAHRLAGPTLGVIVATLVQADGYDDAVAIKHAPGRYAEMWKQATPDSRSSFQSQLDRRYEQILTPLMDAERSKMNGALSSKNLGDAAQWYSSFETRYINALGGPQIDAVNLEFRKRRDAQISAALPEVKQQVASAKTVEEMNAAVAHCCALASDRRVAGYSEVQALVDQRTASLTQHDAAIARENAKARALGTEYQQGGQVVQTTGEVAPRISGLSKTSPDGGPSSSEIYDALQAKLDQRNEAQRNVQKECSHLNSRSPQDPVLGIQCLQNMLTNSQGKYDQQANVTGLKRLECAKAVGQPGYICDYIVSLSVNMPMPQSLGKMLDGQVAEARFIRLTNGWMLMPSE